MTELMSLATKNGTVEPQRLRFYREDGRGLIVPKDAIEHLTAHPDVSPALLREALERLSFPFCSKEVRLEIDFGRLIGSTSKVEAPPINPDTPTTFAQRKRRNYPSRVVCDQLKPPSSILSMIGERTGSRRLVLRSAYIGTLAPLEPYSLNSIRRSRVPHAEVMAFWCRHALVYDPTECDTTPFVSSWAEIVGQARADQEARRMARLAEQELNDGK